MIDVKPRNWIPQQKWNLQSQAIRELQAMNSNFREHSRKSRLFPERRETEEVRAARKNIALTIQESKHESGEHSQNLRWQITEMGTDCPQNANDSCRKCEFGENSQNSLNQQ